MSPKKSPPKKKPELTPLDRKILHQLSGDLPLSPQPYQTLARRLRISEPELLKRARRLLKAGYIRKMGAVLSPRQLGFSANGMAVFSVPPRDIIRLGEKLASFPDVTHCYERPPAPEFEYNLYAMFHGRTRKEITDRVSEIARKLRIKDYRVLFSSREFKKSSLRILKQLR